MRTDCDIIGCDCDLPPSDYRKKAEAMDTRTPIEQAARERADQLRSVTAWNVERHMRADGLASTVHHLAAALGALPAGGSENTRHSIEHALQCARGNLRAALNEPNPFV